MTEKRREYKRAYDRIYRLTHKEKIRETARQYYLANRQKYLENAKMQFKRIMSDPDLYAKHRARKNAWTLKNREKINSSRRAWRKAHKRREKMARRLERDRRKMRFRECPELYAEYRRKSRIWQAAYIRRKLITVRPYRPCLSRRIPDTCCYDRVLDTRSVFLWNNRPAASLVAGRYYRMMQLRETYCDRFGRICR